MSAAHVGRSLRSSGFLVGANAKREADDYKAGGPEAILGYGKQDLWNGRFAINRFLT